MQPSGPSGVDRQMSDSSRSVARWILFVPMATRSKSKSKLWRFWGYGVLAILLLSLGSNAFGPGIYAVLVGLLIFFVLFQAPVYCGAINRRRGGDVEFCRNNSAGLLLGCHLR